MQFKVHWCECIASHDFFTGKYYVEHYIAFNKCLEILTQRRINTRLVNANKRVTFLSFFLDMI